MERLRETVPEGMGDPRASAVDAGASVGIWRTRVDSTNRWFAPLFCGERCSGTGRLGLTRHPRNLGAAKSMMRLYATDQISQLSVRGLNSLDSKSRLQPGMRQARTCWSAEALEKKQSVRDLCAKTFKDFQFGLKLITQIPGRRNS